MSPQDAGICQPIIGGQEARLCAVTVRDRYRNRDFALLSLDIRDRNLSARPTITPIGIRKAWGAEIMTTAIGTYNPIEKYVAHEHDDFISAVASINAIGGRGDTDSVESKPRWRLTEQEIVRAATTMILVFLTVLMALSAGAILTMG